MRDADHKKLSLLYENVGTSKQWGMVAGFNSRGYWQIEQKAVVHADTILHAIGKAIIAIAKKDQEDPRYVYHNYWDYYNIKGYTIVVAEEAVILIGPPELASKPAKEIHAILDSIFEYIDTEGTPLPEYEQLLDSEDPDTFSDLL